MKVDVKIYKTKGEGAVKAFATVTLDDAYAVRNLKIVDGTKGLFVAMPSEPIERDGKQEYRDTFHPVNSDARKVLVDAVMDAYNNAQ
jgi:stage V sporulation protein G